jgi:paraquat-inducible protein A
MTHEPTGAQLGLYHCPMCTQIWQRDQPSSGQASPQLHCPNCHTALHHEKPHSLVRTWAYTLAALVLYVPANILPIMATKSLGSTTAHTILGGIHELWVDGDWGLAVIVFVASVAVPVLKLLILILLATTAQKRSHWRSLERARLLRFVQAVGHWSMLDVFVVLLLVGMIRFGPFAGVEPLGGLLAFGSVVVCTLLATHSFDARLLWPARAPSLLENPPP